MRPLFLFCRASGASIKYLYDKTFEMNRKCSLGRVVTGVHRPDFALTSVKTPSCWTFDEPSGHMTSRAHQKAFYGLV